MPHTITTSFLPSRDGFAFPNQFRNGTFNTYGRCNGMAWTALDYFHAGRPIPAITEVDFERPLESGLAAAITPDGIVQLFAWRWGDPRQLVGKTLRGRDFADWGRCFQARGPIIAPAACSWAPDRTDLLIVKAEHQLWHVWHDGPVLSSARRDCSGRSPGDFETLEFQTDRQPAIASPFPDRLEVYAIGLHDRALWFRFHERGWHGWDSMGRPPGLEITSGCAAVSQVGFMAGYVRGSDNAMWEMAWEGGGWQPWRAVGDGRFTSGPAAASPFPGRVELYGRGLDGAIWLAIRTGSVWSGWSSLGAPPGGAREEAPAAVAAHGLLDLFVRGNDGKVWRRTWQNGGWLDWEAIESTISDESRRLTHAIYWKMMTSTHNILIPATGFFGFGLLFLGPVRNYITWRTPSNEQTFRWTATDELRKLQNVLTQGPIPLGLLDYSGGWGHEVVAFGLESDSNLPPGSFEPPGDFSYSIRVYDPNHPGCDDVRISFDGRDIRRRTINESAPAIRSSTGETWRGCFVRDDYRPDTPPV